MRLLVDAGNSRVKWQLRDQNTVVQEGSDALRDGPLFTGLSLPQGRRVARVSVSTVMSEAAREQLSQQLQDATGVEPRFYWSESGRNGLLCAYAEPERLGADRWHALYGAWFLSSQPAVVIDAGSAITIDYLGKAGVHEGGYIMPGLAMMLRSLRQDAARIGFTDEPDDSREPGTSTTACVHNGLNFLWHALIEQLCREASVDAYPRCLVTGGDAPRLLALGLRAQHRADLVLEGLDAIDREERGSGV